MFSFVFLVLATFINTEKTLRYTFSLVNVGNCAPSSIVNGIDILKETWPEENANDLTAIGARKQYLLGRRNKYMYITQKKFLSSDYLNDEFYVASLNTTCSLESSYAHLLGIFNDPPKIEKAKESMGVPPRVNFDDPKLDDIKSKLGSNVVLKGYNVFKIHSIQDQDEIVGLENQGKCAGVDNYVSTIKSDKLNNFYNNFKKTYQTQLQEAKIIGVNEEINIGKAFDICDSFLKGNTEGREFSSIKTTINLINFKIACENIVLSSQVQKYDDSKKYISKISSSKLIEKIIDWQRKRIDRDIKISIPEYLPYDSTKYTLFMVDPSFFTSFSVFIKDVFDVSTLKIDNVYASSFQFELLREGDNSFIESNFSVKILFNDDTIYEGSFNSFEETIKSKSLNNDEVNTFCGLKDNSDVVYIIVIVVVGVFFMALSIYLLCLKLRRDRTIKVLNKMLKSNTKETEPLEESKEIHDQAEK